MAAGRKDLLFEAGTTWGFTFGYYDAIGTLINTAGYQARMQIRASPSDPVVLLDASNVNGMLTVGRFLVGTANEYNLRLVVPPSVSGAVPDFGKATYDLIVVDLAGVTDRLLQGFVRYSAQTTQ